MCIMHTSMKKQTKLTYSVPVFPHKKTNATGNLNPNNNKQMGNALQTNMNG